MSLHARSLLLLLAFVLNTVVQAEKPQLTTRVFKIPSDLLPVGGSPKGGDAGAAAAADPFAAGVTPTAPDDSVSPRATAKAILEAQGITFPKGTSATFDPTTGLLSITNTQANLDLVEAYVKVLSLDSPCTIACIVTVIEGPGEIIRQANAAASHTTDASKELATLLGHAKKPGSNVRVVGDAFLETKSGTRAITNAVREHVYVSALEMDAKSRSSAVQEMRPIGLHLEYEPTLGADGVTIDSTLSLEVHPAPPAERQFSLTEPITGSTAEFPTTEIHCAHFTTAFTSTSGSTKLVGITKAVGTPKQSEDTLWAAFVTLTVRRVESLPSPAAATAPVAQTPSGLKAAAFNVPDGLFESFMEQPQPVQAWFEANGITPVKGASARHTHGLLQIINTPDNIERIAALIDECLRLCPRTVAFTLHTLQAPAAFLRNLTRQIVASADDAAMLAAVEDAMARGDATFIDSIFLETKSGMRASHESQREHVYVSEFGTDDKGQPHLAFEMRPVGSILQIEPVVRADGLTVEIALDNELHTALPETRHDHFRDPASNKAFEMPAVDFHLTKTITGISVTKGGTKLISLNKPTGRGDADVLWATFLKCDVVPHVAKRVTSAPEKPRPLISPSPHTDEQFTRAFRVDPLVMEDLMKPEAGSTKSAKQVFEDAGISFPEGASVSYGPATSQIIVRNTSENLDKVAQYLENLDDRYRPLNTSFTAHVLQGPGPLLRRLTAQAAAKSNHRAELDELLAAVKAGTVQHLNTARIETKSGTRATSTQANEHIALSEISVNDKGVPRFEQEMREVGFRVELEPTVGADGVTIEVTLAPEFHTAPPLEHREFVIDTQGRRLEFPLTDYFIAKTTTCITMPDGTARLLSLYKPMGRPEFETEDILQAVFITCDILRVGE
ncbi:hypothetical protein [Prosthecobacter sp.]|uniref:hypothetical protein n=1 Tax=Prosthecobacter sp. TaxID=1965333 RepID=UPI001D6E7A0B|nr:hypothetical protein [Prosthecobacter sp.]MCB1276658.1 hypothetical protein [Prosthecobacter sp.]